MPHHGDSKDNTEFVEVEPGDLTYHGNPPPADEVSHGYARAVGAGQQPEQARSAWDDSEDEDSDGEPVKLTKADMLEALGDQDEVDEKSKRDEILRVYRATVDPDAE